MNSYLGRLAGIESSGNPQARSKTSSASGLYQMTRGTFDALKRSNPKLASISWEQHAQNPQIQQAFAQALTTENQDALKRRGLPVNDLNSYLSHFAGAGGAARLLSADPNARVADILSPEAVKANPNLIGQKTTIADLLGTFQKKLGGAVPQSYDAAKSLALKSQNPMQSAMSAGMPAGAPLGQMSRGDLTALINSGSIRDNRQLIPTAMKIAQNPQTPIAMLATGGGVEKLESLAEANARYQSAAPAAKSAAKDPWSDYSGESAKGDEKLESLAEANARYAPAAKAKSKKAANVGAIGPTGFGQKARNFLSDTFSGAAQALNTRPEQISGNVLTGVKIREKTPEEEAKGPTRAAGRARFWSGVGQGALVDPIAAVGQMVAPEGGKADRAINSQMGGYEDFRKQLGGEGFDASRLSGNVASPIAIKGAGAVNKLLGKTGTGLFKRGAIQGVLGGALQPVVPGAEQASENAENPELGSGFWGDKAAQVGTGAIAGGTLNKLLGKAVLPASGGGTGIPGSPVERYRNTFPDADLTWGQHLGERMNRAEQRAMSFPFLGDVIREARQKSLQSQNVGMMNKALGDAGLKLDRGTKSGRHMFDEAYNKLTGAYDNVLDDVSLTDPQALRAKIYGKMDTGDGKSLATGEQLADSYQPGVISQKYNSLSEAGQQRFDKIIESGLFSKFGKDPKGNHAIGMDGNAFKRNEEDLKDTIDSLMHGGGEEREIGKMLKKSLGEAYNSLQSSKPEVQNQLKKLNKSYAKYKTLETASTASSASEGIFTPAQSIRAATKGNRNAVSRGKGLLQEEAELSEQVLGKTYPDSGTAGRLQSGNLAKDLVGGALSFPLELAYSPKVAGAVLDGGGKAKRAFQGTRLGSKIASGAGQGIPASTRALLAPRVSEPEEEDPPYLAHGGMIGYAPGGYVDSGYDLANSFLQNKLHSANIAQMGVPMQPLTPEQQQQLAQPLPIQQQLQQQSMQQPMGQPMVQDDPRRNMQYPVAQGMQQMQGQELGQHYASGGRIQMPGYIRHYASGGPTDSSYGTDELLRLLNRNKEASAAATQDPTTTALSEAQAYFNAIGGGGSREGGGGGGPANVRAPTSKPVVHEGGTDLSDLPYGLEDGSLPYGGQVGAQPYGGNEKALPYSRGKKSKKKRSKVTATSAAQSAIDSMSELA